MKKLHWTDSEIDRTYFLFAKSGCKTVMYSVSLRVYDLHVYVHYIFVFMLKYETMNESVCLVMNFCVMFSVKYTIS